jgi:hypothetical protein
MTGKCSERDRKSAYISTRHCEQYVDVREHWPHGGVKWQMVRSVEADTQPRSSHDPRPHSTPLRSACFTVGTTAKKWDERSTYAGIEATASMRSFASPSK